MGRGGSGWKHQIDGRQRRRRHPGTVAEAFRAAAEEGENDHLLMSKLTTTFILDPFQLNYGRQLKRYGGSNRQLASTSTKMKRADRGGLGQVEGSRWDQRGEFIGEKSLTF